MKKHEVRVESVEEFKARGGVVKKAATPAYRPSTKTRFKFKDLGKAPGEISKR